MNIACIGWGSLIYDPRELRVLRGEHPEDSWCAEGPLLPIEFARHSSADRITLVIVPGSQAVKTFWNSFVVRDLPSARESLGQREGIPVSRAEQWIGDWHEHKEPSNFIEGIMAAWARRNRLHAVVWTNLPPKWADEVGRIPTQDEVLQFLGGLPARNRTAAEAYIRMAPKQIDTPYRRAISARFGWTPTGRI